ncbi:MAG: ribosome biogenesis GTPase Der [Planctomycetota bacterium]|nr:ribosome biogenesis GTPase Der [Planctomycetota bacterium]MDW8373399.1 ribosome biogenesis GTPase Der [Planctomycetota bacterium]
MRPTVAIVGRPNVGKSSLFNRLVGQPIAIVDPTPGTTRDRLLHPVRRDGLRFDLVDTGGIGIVDEAKLAQDVYQQVQRAIAAADRIVFLCDARAGLHPLDREIAALLRPHRERVLLAVNKVDHEGLEAEVGQFLTLGLGEPVAISAAQATGLHELLERLSAGCPAMRDGGSADDAESDAIRLALVGRRNVGKSSLTNALCGEPRVIVADLPGTTRDAVDVELERDGQRFVLIDTAGLRKRAQMREDDLEFFSACRTERAIRRADVVLFVIDAAEEIAMVDKRIARFIEAESKPCVLVVNKWDIAERAHASKSAYRAWLDDRLPGLAYAPAVFTCALTGLDVELLLTTAARLHAAAAHRVPTARLNEIIAAAVQQRRPRKVGPQPTRIYYATQAEVRPPTIIVFVNRTDWLEPGYARYLEHFVRREVAEFAEIPLRILFKARDSRFHGQLDEHRVVRGRTKAERHATLILPAHLIIEKRRADRRRRLEALDDRERLGTAREALGGEDPAEDEDGD